MSLPDLINATFEFGGSIAICMSIARLLKDKEVKGIAWPMIAFFTSWGAWNTFYYPWLDQWLSFGAGVLVLTTNLVYLSLLLYYSRKPKREFKPADYSKDLPF